VTVFSAGRNAPGQCPRCGFRYLLSELQPEVVAGKVTSLRVCPDCLDEDNPQLLLGRLRVSDPQTLRNPSPPLEQDLPYLGNRLGVSFVLGSSTPAAGGQILDVNFFLDDSELA
jgi:hypothetical protein